MVSSEAVTVTEPDFTDEDLAAVVAWADDRDARCPGCDQYRDESMAKGADRDYDATPIVCHACATVDRAQNAARDRKLDPNGVKWRVFRRTQRG